MKTLGDGFLATFDGPARAVRCATSIIEGVRSLDLQVRGGIHTGEIEIKGDDIAGIAVHKAARVAGLAAGGQAQSAISWPGRTCALLTRVPAR